jgi:hypothetical protein
MATMKKKVMGKPMKKAQKGTKAPKYDDDMNDRLMADTYAQYEEERRRQEAAKNKPKATAPNPRPVAKPSIGKIPKSAANPPRAMKKGGVIKKKK